MSKEKDFLEAQMLYQKQISDLEAKLAESQNCACKHIGELTKIATEKDRKIEELKQQLAEKENELDIRTFEADMNATTITKMRESKHQDKISFAVEQLEKVREKINDCPITDYDTNKHFVKMYQRDAIRQLDNQIEELKKEMK